MNISFIISATIISTIFYLIYILQKGAFLISSFLYYFIAFFPLFLLFILFPISFLLFFKFFGRLAVKRKYITLQQYERNFLGKKIISSQHQRKRGAKDYPKLKNCEQATFFSFICVCSAIASSTVVFFLNFIRALTVLAAR